MIPIGQLARLLGITPRTLRHYDAIGLFPPALVHPDNSYRYYRPEQIAMLERILRLRQLAVPLERIQELKQQGCLEDGRMFAAFLREHRSALVQEIAARSRLLDEIDQFISHIEKGKNMDFTPVIVAVPAFEVTGLSIICEDPTTIPALWDRFNPRCSEIGGKCLPVRCYGVCERIDSERFRYFAGCGTEVGATLSPGFERITVPAQRYARFTYTGPVAGLNEAYREIWASLTSAWQLEPSLGPDFECYDERFTGAESPQAQTDIYVPIK